jgi:hypothetical protein
LNFRYAYVVYESVAVCEKNYVELQNKKLKERTIFVDYAGDKSSYVKKEKSEKSAPRGISTF